MMSSEKFLAMAMIDAGLLPNQHFYGDKEKCKSQGTLEHIVTGPVRDPFCKKISGERR
jgi:hypothetical protein